MKANECKNIYSPSEDKRKERKTENAANRPALQKSLKGIFQAIKNKANGGYERE